MRMFVDLGSFLGKSAFRIIRGSGRLNTDPFTSDARLRPDSDSINNKHLSTLIEFSIIMKLQDLADVAAICEQGSFRKAAAKLGISQATLSHRIERLERQLDTLLFQRSRGATQPTELGSYMAAQAKDLLVDADKLSGDIVQMARGALGQVKIGCGPAPAHAYLASLIRDVRQVSRGLSVVSYIGTTAQLADLLKQGKIDLAICPAEPTLFDDRFAVSQLYEAPLHIAAVPGHPVLKQPSSFFETPLALPVLEPSYELIAQNLFGKTFDQVKNTVFCSDYGVLIDLVRQGDYVTAGPRFAFERELGKSQLETVVLDQRVIHRVHLVRRRRPMALPMITDVEACAKRLFLKT